MSQTVGWLFTASRMLCAALAIEILILSDSTLLMAAAADTVQKQQWGLLEVELKGPSTGNPFLEAEFGATFEGGGEKNQVAGFYDGDGVYRVRFMPSFVGKYRYVTHCNVAELDGKIGSFTVSKPSENNHGPVRIRNTFHFAYADGSPYRQHGTTCYAWTSQSEELQAQTL